MRYTPFRLMRNGLLAAVLCATTATAGQAADYVYVGANIPTAGANAVLGYRVRADGALSPLRGSPFRTQGTGYSDVSYKLGPFDNDQELNISPDQSTLFAVNSGSNTIAGFAVAPDGALHMLPFWPVPSGGDTPVSVGVDAGGLTIANNASNPARAREVGHPDIAGIGLVFERLPFALPDQRLDLPKGSYPTQVLTVPHDSYIYGTTFPTTGTLDVYRRDAFGHLRTVQTITPPVVNGTQAAPLGLWAATRSPYLYVGLVNVNKLGIYRRERAPDGRGRLEFVGTADNSGQALCWIRGTRDGRYLLTANTADNSLSVYDLANPAAPREIQHVVADGEGGLEQFALDHDERHIYVLQAQNSAAAAGHSNRIVVFSFDPRSGALTYRPAAAVRLPLGATIRPSGLIAVHKEVFGLPPIPGFPGNGPGFFGL